MKTVPPPIGMPESAHEGGHPIGGDKKAEYGGVLGWLLGQPFPYSMTTRNVVLALLMLSVIVLFWDPLISLYSLSQTQEHYSHIVLIPWISLYALFVSRTAILSSKEGSPLLGVMLVGLGIFGWREADPQIYGGDYLSMMMLSFVICCWGIFLFCYGVQPLKPCLFGLLFLVFMVPLPAVALSAVVGFLQRSSAEVTDIVFAQLGIPVLRQGFVFSLSNFTVQVAEECSGIRSALSLVITSFVAGHFFLRSPWGKLGLVAVVVPLAIVKNAFRIVGLSLLANYVDPSFVTDSALHRYGGIPLFLASLAILFSIVWLLRKLEKHRGYYSSNEMPVAV